MMRRHKSPGVVRSTPEAEAVTARGLTVLFELLRRLEWQLERGRGPARLLTLGEVAELLRVDPRTVERLVASGNLVAVRFGRNVRVTPDDLAAFQQARRVVKEEVKAKEAKPLS